MKQSNKKDHSNFFKNLLILMTFIIFISCSIQIDTKKSDQENKNTCPDNMIYIDVDSFEMGSNIDPDESPLHKVSNTQYCIDKYEYPNFRGAHPETKLSFLEAQELCVKQGKRLCTEAEWEQACKGTKNYIYPWGNTLNYSKCFIDRIDKYKTGTYGYCVSEFGVFDMSGGIWEWTSDWYQSYPGKVNSFSEIGNKRVLRGGYWLSSFEPATCSDRFPLNPETNDIPSIGTRCCKYLETTQSK
jgi:formylglycine-generating enzyme required for sulfatase activity